MKDFFKNKDNLIILGISLVAFLVGCLAIGPLLSILIVGVADALFFLPNFINKKPTTRKKEGITNMKKEKPVHQKKKNKKIWKKILMVFLILCILGIITCIGFAAYIVIEAPKFKPDDLYKMEPTVLYSSDGTEMAHLGSEKRDNITYDDLPEVLVDAIVATEDSRFFQHNGFDLARFLKASIQQVLTGGGGGASTLTMQVVKNTFTSTTSSGFEGIKRKFTDIYMSVFQVEKKYTKKEILEFYVNSYYLGSGSYGVEQASKTYFGKSAKDMNLAEAAMIAGLFQAPNAYDPYQHPEKAESRRNQVLKLMKRHNYITEEEYQAATSIKVEDMLVSKDGSNSDNEWQPFIDVVVEDVIEYFEEQGKKVNPYTTSMHIYTTMDKDKQSWINNVMDGKTYTWQNDIVDAGISVQDVNTGAIVAIGAGRHRTGERQRVNATQIKRQIGSTSKPLYDYSPGIEYENWSTYQLFVDEPHGYSNGTQINNWDRKYNGLMTMRTALAQSRNIPALKAFQANKNSNILKFVQSVGLHPEVSDGIVHEAHAIGGQSYGENPRTMAAAYASFGNGGYYIKPYSYTKIVLNETNETIETKVEKTKVMSEETAYMMTSMLQSSAQAGLGNQYYVNGAIYGAKTGTSNYPENIAKKFGENSVNDLWVNAVSPDYAISVWYGYQDLNRTVTSTSYTIAHRTLFQAVAKGVFKTGSNWTKPNSVSEVQVEMGSWPAKLPSEYTPSDMVVTELFKSGTEPTEVSDRYSKLSDVTDLKSSITNNKLTLKWTAIKTPNAIDTDYLNQYFSSLYSDESYRQNALSTRLSQNNSFYGKLVYKIYGKDSSGKLNYITETSDSTVTIDVNTSSPTTYVVKSSYSIFTANASDGVSTTVNLENVKGTVTAKLNGKESEEIKKGTTYKVSTSDITVLEDSKDVTSKAKITITIDGNEIKGTSETLDTTVVKNHSIQYSIVYDNQPIKSITKTVKVVENSSNTNNSTKPQ